MKMTELTYQNYKFKFKKNHLSASNKFTHKHSLIIKVKTGDGKTALGEASPLPGFSGEKVIDLIRELDLLKPQIINSDYTYIHNLIPDVKNNSLKFALEQIYFTLDTLKGNALELKIKFNLLSNSLNITKLQFENYSNSVIKVKTGLAGFEEELAAIVKIQNVLITNNIKLRIDPNGMWSKSQVRKFYHTLQPELIDYFEQPLTTLNDLFDLVEEGIPIATDELNYNDALLNEILNSDINILVIKPTVFGGLFNIKEKILNKNKNKRIIISSALESNTGWKHLAFIASNFPTESHGISTIDLYHNDISGVDYFPAKQYIKTSYP